MTQNCKNVKELTNCWPCPAETHNAQYQPLTVSKALGTSKFETKNPQKTTRDSDKYVSYS